MKTPQLSLLLYGLLAATGLTYASNHNPAEPCPPNAPRAKSAYSDYVPAHEVPLQSWQEANANAAAGSGHAGHSMASADDMSAKTPAEQSSAKPVPSENNNADKSADTSSAAEPKVSNTPQAVPKKEPAAQAATPAKAKPAAAEKPASTGAQGIQGKGKILQIDKANAKVKITHEPIEQIGWPKMTMYFKVKEPTLLDQVKEGSDTQFTLEKVGSGYVISGFGK